ncbi:MAG: hypothetical protein ACI8W8_004526 [Rhodothermales bacterium]|jgi:hypothetical protein
MRSQSIDRRSFLRGSGVTLTLPFLEAMYPMQAAAAEGAPRRMIFICVSLGLHAPLLFPEKTGADYAETPYLKLLSEHRIDFSLFSGLSHPDQSGADGHSSEMTWLTAARNPGLGGFRNQISVDQFAAAKVGLNTRYASLTLGTNQTSQSYTHSGVMIPAHSKPSQVFSKLFLAGSRAEVETQMRKLKEGRSIIDSVLGDAGRLNAKVGASDRERLDEYFSSVREFEQRLLKAEIWAKRPKPTVEAPLPEDIEDEKDLIGRMGLLFDLLPLVLQTDSTRIITVHVQGRSDVPPVPGVSIDHHNLSHHGKDEEKLRQLRLIEEAEFRALNSLLSSLKAKREGAGSLLDNSMVLFGSNLGNANSHDVHNLPIILAGGGFKHGSHIAYDAKDNQPLCRLFVSMLQQMGVETDQFATGTGRLPNFNS